MDEAIDERIDDAIPIIIAPVLAIVLAAMEFWRSYRHDTFHPWVYLTIAVVASLYAFLKCRKILAEVKAAKLGRDGERIVAEFLEPLRKSGYEILHDVVGGNFNVDHVLVGPSGVFAIETKTRSKSGGQEEKAQFDGKDIFIHGRQLDPNPLIQAKANAKWIRETLKNSTSKDYAVIPVVLFPGWYVEQKTKQADALVLNPKSLETFLKHRPMVLSQPEIAMAAFHLKQFIRNRN